ELRIWVEQEDALPRLNEILTEQKGGSSRIVLLPGVAETCDVEIRLRGGYRVTPLLGQKLKMLEGISRVEQV
ncbi:MAG: hypothetical protein ABF673_03720, partial [Acetobacter persici]